MSYPTPKIIFSDFDGTLTQGEALSKNFFDVLELVAKLSAELVIVTGRSVSWAHFLLTHFPLKTVISEGGGVISRKHQHDIVDHSMATTAQEKSIARIAHELPLCFLDMNLTADSFGRRTDRAIDLSKVSDVKIRAQVEEYLQKEGASFSSSSVHLNFWMGDFTKASTALEYLKRYHTGISKEQCLFFGDGLNDQSMFTEFPHSVGVSNIALVLNKLSPAPAVVLKGEACAGVLGVVHYLKSLLA